MEDTGNAETFALTRRRYDMSYKWERSDVIGSGLSWVRNRMSLRVCWGVEIIDCQFRRSLCGLVKDRE